MSKVRVYEVARQLGINNRDLVALFQSLGFHEVRNHMSAVEADVVDRVKRKLERQQGTDDVVEERIRPTVVKRRSKVAPVAPAPAPSARGAGKGPAVAEDEAAPAAEPTPRPEHKPVKAPSRRSSAGLAPEAAAALAPVPLASERGLKPAAEEPTAGPPPAVVPDFGPEALPDHPGLAEPMPAPVPPTGAEPVASEPPALGELAPEAFHGGPPHDDDVLAAAPTATAGSTPDDLGGRPLAAPAHAAAGGDVSTLPRRPSVAPKTGIDVWEGRPGVPMPQRPRVTNPAARRTTYDPRAAVPNRRPGYPYGGPRTVPGRPVRPGFRRGPGGMYQGRGMPTKGGQVSTKEMSAHKMVIKIEGETSLHSLAGKMSLKATDVLMRLLSMGMTGVNINTTLDADTAKLLAGEFGWSVEDISIDEESSLEAAMEGDVELEGGAMARAPIVTVMGHVDHGKTTLLDLIRKTSVAASEAGGITQHIGAYRVETSRGTIAFLDTPGHEAFTSMRMRGATVTDLVVLVVAADDGVMPQTREAIAHARNAKVPLIVAINKIDMPGVDPERVMRELSAEGLNPEEWGGDTLFCRLSAKTGQGVDALLDVIMLQAEMLELAANPARRATGVVIEALLDRGRGPVARVLVQDGTLHRGDVLLAGAAYGKIRAMIDEKGRQLAEAGPSTPVEVLGLNEVPSAGDPAHAVKDIKAAEAIAVDRRKKTNRAAAPQDTRMSLETLTTRLQEGEQLELNVIIKADVQGSVEALVQSLTKLSTQKVKLNVVHTNVGGITETDVGLAAAAKAVIIGFNVRPAGKAKKVAEEEGVEIRLYEIIYEAIDDVRSAMEGLLPATKVEKALGKAQVREVFRISKVGAVAGCMVVEGLVRRGGMIRLVRDSVVVWSGKMSSLRRFKEDTREVKDGMECGIALEGFADIKEGDILECFELEEVKATL
jgi:translation initiation factor IF-2